MQLTSLLTIAMAALTTSLPTEAPQQNDTITAQAATQYGTPGHKVYISSFLNRMRYIILSVCFSELG